MSRVNLGELFGVEPLTNKQKARISKTILPKLDTETLELLYKKIEWLVALDRATNSPGPDYPLDKRLGQLSRDLLKCLATINSIEKEGTTLNNLDTQYWQSNAQDTSMQDLATQLRKDNKHLLHTEDIRQASQYFSISGTRETILRIQKTVSDWQSMSKPGSKPGRKPPTQHRNLIFGLIEFFNDYVPEKLYKVSKEASSKFHELVVFALSDLLYIEIKDATKHLIRAIEDYPHFK